MLSIVLTGAALIREREHGTIEHLLVMPVTAFEIMVSKVWSMGLILLAASAFSLVFVVGGVLAVSSTARWSCSLPSGTRHLRHDLPRHLSCYCRRLYALVRAPADDDAPQQLLSGGITPLEIIQIIMLVAPNAHFVMLAQAVLFWRAGLDVVWPQT